MVRVSVSKSGCTRLSGVQLGTFEDRGLIDKRDTQAPSKENIY